MRYAIISDIHANLEALISVLSHIEKQHVDSIICLGDVVGYGPSPNECIALVKQTCDVVLTGNHDFACINEKEKERFNRYARTGIEWTIASLTEESNAELQNILLEERIESFLFVHASPDEPAFWNYIVTIDHAISNFSTFDDIACFFGHTHLPVIFCKYATGGFNVFRNTTIVLDSDNQYLINVGSVGQPRDSNPRASYGILDTTTFEYCNQRVEYDFKKTQKLMQERDLPAALIDRIAHGR